MKVYIKKIASIILVLSIILTCMNIGSYVSYAEDTENDFSYYYVGSESDVKTCSATEINDVIENATGDMVIELNKDLILSNNKIIEIETYNRLGKVSGHTKYNIGLYFGKKYNYTLELNNHTLSVEEGPRVLYIEKEVNLTIKNGTISGANVTSKKAIENGMINQISNIGAGIYCTNATLNINNVRIIDNKGGSGAAIYATASAFNAKDSSFANNVGNSNGAAIYIDEGSKAELTNCLVSGNNFSAKTSMGGAIYISKSTLNATNLKVLNNCQDTTGLAGCGGVYVAAADGNELTLKDSLIAGNCGNNTSSIYAAGLAFNRGIGELTNTVIRDNIGNRAGGLSASGILTSNNDDTKLTITGGAIYNNTANSPYKSGLYGHDIIIDQKKKSNINILAADKMISDEEDKTFTGYYWNHNYGSTEYTNEKVADAIAVGGSDSTVYHMYTASDAKERIVAEIGEQKFKTIQEAIDTANNGDTIKLVVGEEDKLGEIINEAITIDDEKNITIDLNGKKWSSGNSKLNTLTIDGNATIKVVGEGTLSNIDYRAGSLELDSVAKINTITLGSGKIVKAGNNFGVSKALSFELSAEDTEKLKTEDITLIEKTNDISDKILEKVSINDADPLVVVKKDSNGNIIAHTLTGVFLNGESGDDSKDGKTLETAVKTFAKAKEIVRLEDDGIFVTGTVTVEGTEEWSDLPEGVKVLRYGKFVDEIANVKGTLTVKDITIDGQSEKVIATEALIKVAEGGTLNIGNKAVLTNNNNTKSSGSYYVSGGAVYSNGKVNMNGGEVSENTSLYGAGIELWGETASMTLEGGSIKNNVAENVSSSFGAGAGIAVMNGAKLIMNGGNVEDNASNGNRGSGGGILVGNILFTPDTKGSIFTMNGGTVSGNDALLCGGGIYVQCLSKATINAGEIINNSCGSQNISFGAEGSYGGGGIYVNGGRAGYEDGKLYLANAYISDNTASGKNGAGIAGCGTSTVYIYPETTTIYKNNGETEIYVDKTTATGFGTTAEVKISKIAAGGGENNWTNINGEKVSLEDLTSLEEGEKLKLTNVNAEGLDTEGKLASVKITGNTSKTLGGGIGTNGYVQIGEDKTIYVEVKVTKTWEDNDDEHKLRPDSITVHLLANGEEVAEKEMTAADNWEYTFTELEKYDENEEKIEYTIKEDEVEEYKTEIDGYDITNICTKEEGNHNKEDEEGATGEDEEQKDESEPNIGENSTTGDSIIISFIALAVSGIVLSRIYISKKHTAKHRK